MDPSPPKAGVRPLRAGDGKPQLPDRHRAPGSIAFKPSRTFIATRVVEGFVLVEPHLPFFGSTRSGLGACSGSDA
jgi:hypothetical protein